MSLSPLSLLLEERYGETNGPVATISSDTVTPVLESLLAHRSVRNYLPRSLPDNTLALLIAAAQSASSSSNVQLWSVVAIEQAERKQRISTLVGNQAHVREAPLFLAWLVDLSRIQRFAKLQGKTAAGCEYLEAFLTGAIDAALAAQNLVAAAESLGLGAVYIGGLRNQPSKVREELELQDGVFPIFGLCIGYPDDARPSAVKPRLPQSAVLHREQYQQHPIQQEIGNYDQIMKKFSASQNLPVKKWSEQIVERWRDASSLHGPDRLREELLQQGFTLR